MKSNKEKIKKLYFEKKLKQKEIAIKLKISTNLVSRIVRADSRYEEESKNRKLENKKKHNKQIQNIVEEKRKNNNPNDYILLKAMHDQASRELSGERKPISDRAFRDWNTSAYRYDYKTKSYILKKEITTGQDVPTRVNWKNFV